jgi:protein-tyrosine phosphatase
MKNRILPFNGIHNFRDYGGYATATGERVRSGLLYRSGQHREAYVSDLATVAALDLVSVIDLRGDRERAAYPCPRHPEFGAAVLFAEGETSGHVADGTIKEFIVTEAQAYAAMMDIYRGMPFRGPLIAVLTSYFAALAERPGASLVHCLAGKDRTGMAVALLHDMLGVHRDDLLTDYLLTNTAGNIEARIAAGAAPVRNSFGPDMTDDAVRVLMSVDAAFLETAFGQIELRYGSLENYRMNALGITEERRTAILDNLLA